MDKFNNAIDAIVSGATRLKEVVGSEEDSSYQDQELGPTRITNAAYCLHVAHQLYNQTVAAAEQAEQMAKAEQLMATAMQAREQVTAAQMPPSPLGSSPLQMLVGLATRMTAADRYKLIQALQFAGGEAQAEDDDDVVDPRVQAAEQVEARVRGATGESP